jgi:hypothetical protein
MQQLEFNTDVDVEIDFDSHKPEGYDYESRDTSTTFKYLVLIEIRSYGIKSLCTILPEQEITIEIELLAKDSEDSERCAFKVKLAQIDVERSDNYNLDQSPTTLTLTLENIKRNDDRSFEATATGTLSMS